MLGRHLCRAVVVLLIACALLPGGRAAAAPPRLPAAPWADGVVAIRPESNTVSPGETFSVEVKIEGSTPVVASDVQILFDTSYLEGLSVEHSGIFDGYFVDDSDLAAGKIWFGGGTFGTRTPPFVFATLTFRAKDKLGTTPLAFNPDEVYLEGVQGSVLGSVVDGAVTIASSRVGTYLPLVIR